MAANRIPQPLGLHDLVEAYICYRQVANGLESKNTLNLLRWFPNGKYLAGYNLKSNTFNYLILF